MLVAVNYEGSAGKLDRRTWPRSFITAFRRRSSACLVNSAARLVMDRDKMPERPISRSSFSTLSLSPLACNLNRLGKRTSWELW